MTEALFNALDARPPQADVALDLIDAGHRLTPGELAALPNKAVGLYLQLLMLSELLKAAKHCAQEAKKAATVEAKEAAERNHQRFVKTARENFEQLIAHIHKTKEARKAAQEREQEEDRSPGLGR